MLDDGLDIRTINRMIKEEKCDTLSVEARRKLGYRRRQSRKEYLDKLKSKPCADCGKSYPPYVMDFDHVRGSKVEKISNMLSSSFKDILMEVSKCEVVCANCHRERTYQKNLTQAS